MAACCGSDHTITLSTDGTLHSFGRNEKGQLGLGHNNDVSLPTPIPNLPEINMVSCGRYFTICVDCEGFIWSFGSNKYGQLGTGNTTDFNVPQQIEDIPPVLSVSCGYEYVLIITTDSNLWSCGRNEFGQLCIENDENQLKPQKTSFSNISKISCGTLHSLFQNDKGEIFSCGYNKYGQCGLGHFNHPQITPSLILNLPSNIVQFVCGHCQTLFLDSEGNVYSVGLNRYGQLGLGHKTDQNVLSKIVNIPPIQTISCVYASCYLVDFEGNLWTFGNNDCGQLGHGDKTHINIPKVISTLKDIQQISYGCTGNHFFTKNSQNQIFSAGYNNYGQLGTGDTRSVSILKELNSQHFTIWGSNQHSITKEWNIKCLESTMNWKAEEMQKIEMIQAKIKQVKLNLQSNNNNKIKQEFPQNSFESWNKVDTFLNKKLKQIYSKMDEKQDIELQNQKNVQTYEIELEEINNRIQKLQERKEEIEENLLPKAKGAKLLFEETFKEIEKNQKTLKEMCSDVATFCKNENEMNQELGTLFKEKKLEEFDCSEISKVLWKMDLTKYQSIFDRNQINGAIAFAVDDASIWKQLGLDKRDRSCALYYFEMMKTPGYSRTFSPGYKHDCCVCSHNTPEKTIHLLKEYDIPVEDDFILKNNYTAPMLISKVFLKDVLGKDFFSQKGIQIILKLGEWKKMHKIHLRDLKNKK